MLLSNRERNNAILVHTEISVYEAFHKKADLLCCYGGCYGVTYLAEIKIFFKIFFFIYW